MRFTLPLLTAATLIASATAQTTLVAHTSNDNGIANGTPGLFFDFAAGANTLTVTELRTASNRAPGATFEVEVLTYWGSTLGGTVTTGPGTSPVGWNSLGIVTGTQGAVENGTSLPIDIPDIVVGAGRTVGVALIFTEGGVRFFGTGSTLPVMFSNGDLTLTTGEVRGLPFAVGGSHLVSRGLHGEITYVLGGEVGLGSTYCGPAAAHSAGSSAAISALGSNVAANNDLMLVASSMPLDRFGMFLVSPAPAFTPGAGGSNGNLCIANPAGRYDGAGQIQMPTSGGSMRLRLDLTRTPLGQGLVTIGAGETWYFQCWFRDSSPMGQPRSNFTTAIAIRFD